MTTINDLAQWKREGRRFPMLTAYDFATAQILDQAGIPVLLVGDSVANNVLGYETTLPVTMDEMLHHARAVSRGTENALLVGDMPFLSYQASVEEAMRAGPGPVERAAERTARIFTLASRDRAEA